MLAVLCVEQPFDVPMIDLDTGEELDRALVGTLDLIERDAAGRVVVVDLKTSARKYTSLQTEASLQLSVYSYAAAMNGLADQEDPRLRLDVPTKTKQPELCHYWTQRDRAANLRLFRLVAEVLHAIEAGVFHPNTGWQCKGCPFRSRCWAWREAGRVHEGMTDDAVDLEVEKSKGERLREGGPGARSVAEDSCARSIGSATNSLCRLRRS
jgi:CRISPR/Cas system-associated exonuclease Cas4 (RecB family)